MIAYPFLKLVTHACVTFNMSICSEKSDLVLSWPIKYISTLVITSETVFWSIFLGV